MTVDIIGATGTITYTLGMNKHTSVSGIIVDIVSLSETNHFIVLSTNGTETLVGIDAIYSIVIKKRKTKPEKPDIRQEVM